MANFFFDGGDMGAHCHGDGSMCASGSCGAYLNDHGFNKQLIDNNWNLTGCNTKTPDWAYVYYADGGADSIYTDYCRANETTVEYKTCHGTASYNISSCTRQTTPDDPTACVKGDEKCTCGMDSNALVPNTTIGWCIQILGTYLGFIFMFFGVFEATNLHKKILNKWRALR